MNELPFALPRNERAVSETVNESSVLARIAAGIWGLHFQLYIPRGWKIVERFDERVERQAAAVPLALFLEPGADQPALISVVGYRLDAEIGLEDWIDHVLAQREETAFGGAWLKTPAGICWDAGVAQGAAPERTFSRVTAYAANGIIFLITSQCRERRWDQLKGSFLAAHFSFELLDQPKAGLGRLEPWLPWESTAAPRCRTAFPATWKIFPVEASQPTTEAIDAKLIDEGGQLLSYLRLKISRGRLPAPAETLERWINRLRALGFETTREDFVLSREKGILETVAGLQGIWVGMAARGGVQAEVRIIILHRPNVLLALICIGPAQGAQPFLWMRTKRASEVAILSFRAE